MKQGLAVFTHRCSILSTASTVRHCELSPFLAAKYGYRSLTTDSHGTLRKENFVSATPSVTRVTDRSHVEAPMARMPTADLLRSVMFGYCFASPRLLALSMKMMNKIVNSKSPILNPDKNPVLGRLLRAFVYNHFCAGTHPDEVRESVARIKKMGYVGVILGYGKEIVLDTDAQQTINSKQGGEATDPYIAAWLQGNLDTLDLIGSGDYMNVKFTGAGESVSQALIEGRPPPKQLTEAMNAMIEKAISQNSRIWIDAEQQIFHPTIDDWAIDLMRRYNKDGKAPVLNTIQSYLKASRQNVLKHLKLASSEGWTVGFKLVRGAYIQQDRRDRIWDTKAETDRNYNGIARDLLSKDFDRIKGEQFPNVHVFLAGHNKESITLASKHMQNLIDSGATLNPVGFGQLHGMADEVGCELIQMYQKAQNEAALSPGDTMKNLAGVPRVYKCLNWGSVRDCMHFLMRRAVENASATDRLQDGLTAAKTELKRRLFRRAAA